MRKITKLHIIVFIVLIFLSLAFRINPVSAEIYQQVHVLCAYDEEFVCTAAQWPYWSSPEAVAEWLVSIMTWRFKSAFSIEFIIINNVFWDSNDSITDDVYAFENEVIAETGFYSGMTYNTIPIDILIAFSDQTVLLPTGDPAAGKANSSLGTVIVFEECFAIFPFYCAHYTDNILQHELSHLYNCPEHWIPIGFPNHDCVMNWYPKWIPFPEGKWRPYGMTTESWCNDCRDLINQNKGKWGRQTMVGGGDPWIFPIPYTREMEELNEP